MPKPKEDISPEELKDRLDRIRAINKAARKGDISWEERVMLHNTLIPGIGDLEHQHMDHGKNQGNFK